MLLDLLVLLRVVISFVPLVARIWRASIKFRLVQIRIPLSRAEFVECLPSLHFLYV